MPLQKPSLAFDQHDKMLQHPSALTILRIVDAIAKQFYDKIMHKCVSDPIAHSVMAGAGSINAVL